MPPKSEAAEDDRLELPEPTEAEVKIDTTPKDEDDDDEPAAAASGEKVVRDGKTGQWAAKKGERARDKKDRDSWKTEKAALEGRMAQMSEGYERQMREIREEIARGRQTPAGGPAPDPFAARLADVDRQLKTELKLMESDNSRDYTEYNKIRQQEMQIIAERVAFSAAQRRGAEQQQGGQNSPYAMRAQLMAAEHPWLGDPTKADLVKKVRHIREYLINVDGLPDTIDTDRQAIATAVAQFGQMFGLRAPAAPTERTRGMYGGPGPGASAQRGAPRQDSMVGVPRSLAAASGLSSAQLAEALRGDPTN